MSINFLLTFLKHVPVNISLIFHQNINVKLNVKRFLGNFTYSRLWKILINEDSIRYLATNLGYSDTAFLKKTVI